MLSPVENEMVLLRRRVNENEFHSTALFTPYTYLKLSIKWTTESSMQDWFLVWSKKYIYQHCQQVYHARYCPFLKQRRHCFKLDINLRLSIRWEKNLTLTQRASITSFCHRTDNFRLISFSQISHSFLSRKLQSLESLMLIFILILMFICMIHLCNVVSKP